MTVDAQVLPEALRTRTSFVLIRLATLLRQDCAQQLARVELSRHQHAILCALAEFGPASQKDVATRLGLDSGDLVAFLDGLHRAGRIDRDRDGRDRRRQVVTITNLGHAALNRANELLDEATAKALAALHPTDRAELHRLASHVLEATAPESWSPTRE